MHHERHDLAHGARSFHAVPQVRVTQRKPLSFFQCDIGAIESLVELLHIKSGEIIPDYNAPCTRRFTARVGYGGSGVSVAGGVVIISFFSGGGASKAVSFCILTGSANAAWSAVVSCCIARGLGAGLGAGLSQSHSMYLMSPLLSHHASRHLGYRRDSIYVQNIYSTLKYATTT